MKQLQMVKGATIFLAAAFFSMALMASAYAGTAATVQGTKITDDDVKVAYETLPEEGRKPLKEIKDAIVERLVDQRLLELAADDAKIEKEKQVAKNLELIKKRLLREEYLRRELDKTVTDSAVKKRYNEIAKEYNGQEEVRARHILVDKEDKAIDMIKQLDKGAKFEDLAKKNSSGPSAERGGDLGWFVRSAMVPAFANAAFNLEKGKYTKAPVQTAYGWHVIMVEDKRIAKAPEFDEVKDELRRALREQEINRVVTELRKKYKVEIDGKEGS